ncbi:hypothetical protein RS130_06380 [Paraglaciecola aquimarina]|uniref:Uncharacterized protein n=1 Tax=Paraglaciecola aquimarina TaxID=1235557 RepID=A0ABU3SUE2_9ALTE|nr:hypothetical protein [Paraglaciecola aquimarina]MDU0353602.1 hypothetical protein [Paraglaciecola aquimarina]
MVFDTTAQSRIETSESSIEELAVEQGTTRKLIESKPEVAPPNTDAIHIGDDDDTGGGGGNPSSYSTELGAEELNKRLTTDSITADTTDLFGETIDLNSGSLSFSYLDASLPWQ